MKLLRLVPQKTTINFLNMKLLAFVLSALLILGTVFELTSKGLNFGTDFTGGIVIELRTEEAVELSVLRRMLSDADFGEVSLQTIGNANDIMIRLQGSEGDRTETINKVKTILEAKITSPIDYRKVDYVGPQVGRELITAGALALGLSFAALMVYIWVRCEWQFGVGAVIALLHDALLTLGLFSLLGLEFNLTSIAAILTIIGYSINDSVVIFDRIRENLRKYKKMSLEELLNISINDTLSRTILTAGTTMAALIALVWLGGEVIKGFSITVLFGVAIGTYSSIYIAAPSLIYMNLRRES